MCSLQKRGRVYILTLSGEGDHRFNPYTIDTVAAALKEVQDSPDAGALVTTNEGRYFSNGLDLMDISESRGPLEHNQDQIRKPAGLLHEARRALHRGNLWARCGGGFLYWPWHATTGL